MSSTLLSCLLFPFPPPPTPPRFPLASPRQRCASIFPPSGGPPRRSFNSPRLTSTRRDHLVFTVPSLYREEDDRLCMCSVNVWRACAKLPIRPLSLGKLDYGGTELCRIAADRHFEALPSTLCLTGQINIPALNSLALKSIESRNALDYHVFAQLSITGINFTKLQALSRLFIFNKTCLRTSG